MSQRLPVEVFVPPLPSFPVPVAPPDETTEQVALCIPATWEAVVRGALQQLIQPTTWIGSEADIKAAQETAATIIANMTVECGAIQGVPTPYWDEVTDTDDQEPTEIQTWYGEVADPDAPADELTFFENAAIWGFTGMLAFSGTPAAALAFNTIAPSFVLAMRGDSFAEVIRILIDGEDYVRVETTGDPDELIEVPVYPDPSLSAHDILIILEQLL